MREQGRDGHGPGSNRAGMGRVLIQAPFFLSFFLPPALISARVTLPSPSLSIFLKRFSTFEADFLPLPCISWRGNEPSLLASSFWKVFSGPFFLAALAADAGAGAT